MKNFLDNSNIHGKMAAPTKKVFSNGERTETEPRGTRNK